ncbi:hypothetical protein ACVBE9_11450 [Eionea flava]
MHLNTNVKTSKKHVLFIFLLGFIVINGGCTTPPPKNKASILTINDLIITNKTSTLIEDVTLRDLASHTFFSCSKILANAECSMGFQTIDAEDHAAIITWRQGTQSYQHRVKAENTLSSPEAVQVHIDIYYGGKLHTYFKALLDID